ncbi:hypothetical protein SOM10_13760 [Microbacterium sp. CFBP9023]|uniref:hypothetical protein n=1 Tax=unclassified Microbacterium TaxID=2609290 RepID=UPI0006F9FF1B|nr:MULTISPECIES: hypothetical protein [unclassified Microbacterium]KRD50571.1 hypothetical protein ASE34_13565 [Microbacterium sp. Root280D1]MDY0984964.1 hypothetical protein [Microbacterium sp. CFBP9023]
MSTNIEIDGRNFVLRDDRPLRQVMDEIEAAASAAPTFITLSGDDRSISVLIRPTTRVVISVEKAAHVDTTGHIEPDHASWDLPFEDWEM